MKPQADLPRVERPPAWQTWAVIGAIVFGVLVVYGQTLSHPFSDCDDGFFVVGNPAVNHGLSWSSVKWAFLEGPGGEWYPLSMLSHMLDCQLFGLSAGGHHFTNLFLHLATAIGLFLLLRDMTGELWPSGLVALLFAVHPQHVESVAWIAERRDVLSGFFFVMTLAAYLGYAWRPSIARYLLVALLLACGLMSKAMLVTLPFLLLVLDWWPLARAGMGWRRLVVEKLPLIAMAGAVGLVTFQRQPHTIGHHTMELAVRFQTAVLAPTTYLWHSVWPADLSAFYPFRQDVPLWEILASCALWLALLGAALALHRRAPYLLVGLLWFLGMLVPVSGIVQVSRHAMADRYTYLPAIGLYIAAAWPGWRWLSRSAQTRQIFVYGGAVVTLLFAVLAARQASLWGDEELLWRKSVAIVGARDRALVHLANVLSRKGKLDEAIQIYRTLDSAYYADDIDGLSSYGVTLALAGENDAAAEKFREILAEHPDNAAAHENLGSVLMQQQKLIAAAQEFQAALDAGGTSADLHVKLGSALAAAGENARAIREFREALRLDPENEQAREGLKWLLRSNPKLK